MVRPDRTICTNIVLREMARSGRAMTRVATQMQSRGPIETDILLLGAGHAHVEVLRRFAMRPEPGVRLTLIGREPETPYSGMLPGVIRGDYSVRQAHIDLAPLAAAAG